MKILVVGGTGTIGQAVVNELKQRHQVLVVGHKNGEIQVDLTQPSSIYKMYQTVGKLDALVVTAGQVHFAKLSEIKEEDYYVGIRSKLMGQVNLVLLGQEQLNEGGSFTLTSGILSQDPIQAGSSASMVNGAIESFVKAAAIELPKGLRINVVSPTVIRESLPAYEAYFRGFEAVPAARAALAYSKSVEGGQTGQIYRVG